MTFDSWLENKGDKNWPKATIIRVKAAYQAGIDHQQARIDAHNREMDILCSNSQTLTLCEHNSFAEGMCDVCPRRYRIED